MNQGKLEVVKQEMAKANIHIFLESAAAAAKSLRRWGQRENNAQLWMRLVIEVQYDAVENNTA